MAGGADHGGRRDTPVPAPARAREPCPAWLAGAALALAPFVFFWRETLGLRLFAPSDAFLYFFPIRVLTAQFLRAGHLPLWNPYVFSGVPYLAEIQTAVLYPPNLLFLVLPPLWAMNLQMLGTYSLAAVATFGYARAAGCSVLGASIGGLTFAGSGFMMGHLPHTGVVQGVAWIPVTLFCLERLRQHLRWRYVAGGAAAVACSVFAGHPQFFFHLLLIAAGYAVYCALICGAGVGRGPYLITVGATLCTGLALSALQLGPTAELAALSVRANLGLHEFLLYSLPLSQLPMLVAPFLFGGPQGSPYWGTGGNIHEVLGYVGLIPLMVVLAALPVAARSRVAWFWYAVAGFGLLMVLGPRTPLAPLMYRVPLYNLFRVAGRHFLHFDLALAVLAAWSVTALTAVRPRWALAAPILVAGATIAVAAIAAGYGPQVWGAFAAVTTPGGFENPRLAHAFAPLSAGVALPALLAVVSALAVVAWLRRPSAATRVAMVATLALDLSLFGALVPHTFPTPKDATVVPGLARQLTNLEHTGSSYRLGIFYAGEHRPARYDLALWDVPLINGYEPLMLSRYSSLTGMTYYGAIGDALIVSRPAVLDLLNTGYLAVAYPPRVSATPAFPQQSLGLDAGPGERLEFSLPLACQTGTVVLASAVRGVAVADGVPVARLRAFGQEGEAFEGILRMGRDTAAWDAADERPPAPPFYERIEIDSEEGATYLAHLELERPLAVKRLVVENITTGSLYLSRLALMDPTGTAGCPLTALHTLRGRPERWERIGGDAAGDLFRNRKALPRAWLVPRVVSVSPQTALRVIQTGVLPDGRPFDARRMALVEDGTERDFGLLDSAAAVRIVAYAPSAIALESDSPTAAFLVLSEIDYPGWFAAVDGQPVPIERTNYILRGLPLTAGRHRIEVVYRPRSVLIGMAISITAVVLLIAALVLARSRERHAR